VSFPLHKSNLHAADRIAAAILFALFFLPLSHAQTIRPVISEYTAKVAKGSIELVNPGTIPLTVIVEPKSFSVSEKGAIAYRPLDKGIQLKLSAMSFQIPPQQSYFIFYEARADVLPAWFVIYASIGGFRRNSSGMNIRLDLPHTVYILPKRSVEKSEILISELGPTPDKAHLGFRVTNTGPWFGRALSSELTGRGGATQGSGFPIFPHSTRIVEVPCHENQAATALRLRLRNFKMEEPLSNPAESQACAP
jgi:hypothetical protein